MPQLPRPDLGVGLAAQLGDDEPAGVAHGAGIDVLVAALDLGDGRAVDAALVRERGPADVRLVVVGHLVRDLGDRPAELGQRGEVAAARRHQRLGRLEREVGEDRDHVRVAAPLAVAVDGRLDVADPRLDRGDRVGHRQLGVVVGVDAPGHGGRVRVPLERRPDVADDVDQLVRQRPAVGVAQDEGARPGLAGGAERRQGVVAVRAVAVEEVLGVVHGLAAAVDDERDRVRDHVQVLGRRRAQDLDDVQEPALAEDRDDRRLRGDQLAQVGVVLGPVGAMPRAPERRQLRVLPALLAGRREEVDVLGVGARPAALDEREPVLVEHARDAQLVGERERDVLALGAVAEGRVVEGDGGAVGGGHRCHGVQWPVRVGRRLGCGRCPALRRSPAGESRSAPPRRGPSPACRRWWCPGRRRRPRRRSRVR